MNNKLTGLDGLRGIAALLVAVFHFDAGGYLYNAFVSNGWLMVDFFFLLSGFVIALNYLDRLRTINDVVNFQWRRLIRLYPLHVIVLMVWLAIEFAKYRFEASTGVIANNAAFSINDAFAFFSNLLMTHAWTEAEPTFNYPSWAMSALFYTYAIFAFLALAGGRSKFMFFVGVATLIGAGGVVLIFTGMSDDNLTGPARCLYSFFIGVCVYEVYRRLPRFSWMETSIPASATMILTIVAVIFLGEENPGLAVLTPLIFALTVLALAMTSESATINQVLSHRALQYLGAISFSVYMTHALVWWALRQFLRFVVEIPTKVDAIGNVVFDVRSPLVADLITLAGVVCIVGLAHLAYVHIESRFASKLQNVRVYPSN